MQAMLEEDYSTQMEPKFLADQVGEDPMLLTMVSELQALLNTEQDYSYVSKGVPKIREDLIEIHTVLRGIDSKEIFTKLFCLLWRKQECTIQVLVGSLWDKLDIVSTFRRTSAIEIILAVFANCPAVSIDTTRGETVMFKCLVPMTEDFDDRGYILPSVECPRLVVDNTSVGYHSFKTPLLLGGKFHTKKLNYAHINRVNSVMYESENRLDRLCKPVFNTAKKVKKNGHWETDTDVLERYKSFKHITDSLPKRKDLLERYSRQYHYCHAYDARGRYYPKAYEFNYQGIKYVKAIVNLAHKEVISGEW
jgi:hypothetical protein